MIEGTPGWERGDWMQLYSGAKFYPLAPRVEDIDLRDIAHALSLLCRYGGHVERFYSVAEHCVLMSLAVEPQNALHALLHDATEAYIVDVPRPLKRQLAGYRDIEDMIWVCIAQRFLIELAVPEEVKIADNRILLDERDNLMPNTKYSWEADTVYSPFGVPIVGWSPEYAEKRYLERMAELL